MGRARVARDASSKQQVAASEAVTPLDAGRELRNPVQSRFRSDQ
jgi:hypothetical protein